MQAAYLNLSPGELQQRAEEAYALYRNCTVCPHACEVDRTGEGRGVCGQSDRLVVGASVQHFGEEPPFTGTRGVGNIFVTSCNLRCDYCQNFQISQDNLGKEYSCQQVAEQMLDLQTQGVHFIGWVSPSHVVPGLLRSLALAREKGLHLPVIYNTNGYDALPTLKLLDGIVDIYLPDLKYAKNEVAREFSHIKNYVDHSRSAVLEMHRQVGPLTLNESGLAESGVVVRHLVLPDDTAGTWETLCFIALELSPKVPVSLMSQYQPVHKAGANPRISRRIYSEEYEAALQMTRELGIETVFTQDLEDEQHNLPDFRKKENPFPLDGASLRERIEAG
ncbi:MAG: 4Fe-4S cluster-binding domain-containing protein [Nitrospinae bacterium]|nr:4Fe-4S cluster-binding domain-containing protein [Nitrospinota bacterium]MDA1110774.1 4Fe-4S cluster-binding domain-containing protein [Nitrospinota bacterium]